MAKKIETTIKINGVEENIKGISTLSDNLDKVNVKTNSLSVSAKDVAATYKNEFQDAMEYIVLQMTKIGAIITELNVHVGQAIEKNVSAGEKAIKKYEKEIEKSEDAGRKAALNLEKFAENNISSMEAETITVSEFMEKWIKKTSQTASEIADVQSTTYQEQSAALAKQLEANNELMQKSMSDIRNKEAEVKEVVDAGDKDKDKKNEKAKKEQVKSLQEYKTQLELAAKATEKHYALLAGSYETDSEEYKKLQEAKAKSLEEFKVQTEKVNTEISQVYKNSLEKWKDDYENFHADIKTKLGKLEKKTEDISKKVGKYFTDYDSHSKLAKGHLDKLETKEKEASNKKYDKKIENLDKELSNLTKDVTEKEKEKKEAEKKIAESEERAAKYKKEKAEIEKYFGKSILERENVANSNAIKYNANEKGENEWINKYDSKKDEGGEVEKRSESGGMGIEIVKPEKKEDNANNEDANTNPAKIGKIEDEDKVAAEERLNELDELMKLEKTNAIALQSTITASNEAIIDSERKVLLEKIRIENEKEELVKEKAKKQEELEKRAQKRKEKLEKLDKIVAKAKLVKDIAEATASVAKGVATAWGLGPIIGPPMAVIAAVAGAMQIKTMTDQLKYMQDGGLLQGRRHTQGGMRIEGSNIEVEGGEYVVNRESTHRNIDLIRYINSQRRELSSDDIHLFYASARQTPELPFRRMFADGGELPVINNTVNVDNEMLVKAIRDIRIEPKVAVTDIHRAQEKMVDVSGWSTV